MRASFVEQECAESKHKKLQGIKLMMLSTDSSLHILQ